MLQLSTKQKLHQRCLLQLEEKITRAEQAIENAQQTANNESKSSAGDKHETARAMAHLEQERHAQVLREALRLKKKLQQINPHQHNTTAYTGSLIKTNIGHFYIAISAGKITMEGTEYWVISQASPIGQELEDLEEEDEFSFRGKDICIESIC